MFPLLLASSEINFRTFYFTLFILVNFHENRLSAKIEDPLSLHVGFFVSVVFRLLQIGIKRDQQVFSVLILFIHVLLSTVRVSSKYNYKLDHEKRHN